MLFFIIDYMCLSSTFYSVLQVLHPYTTLHKLIYIYWLLVLKWYADGTQIIYGKVLYSDEKLSGS